MSRRGRGAGDTRAAVGESDDHAALGKMPAMGTIKLQCCESRWGRHFILRAVNGGQVLERVGGYGGSNKLFSVERDTITEEQPLQPLLLIERGLHPQIRGSR